MPWFKKDPDKEARRRKKEEREAQTTAEFVTQVIQQKFVRLRTILCPGVAILLVENALTKQQLKQHAALLPFEGLGRLFTSEEDTKKIDLQEQNENAKRDAEIASIIGAVLKSNPAADLSPYEQTFGIRIVNIDILHSEAPPRRPPSIDV